MSRKANLHDVFNDGEVMVQKQRCASARVLASPEGITAKISPVKLLAKTALFKGLGKCSRVAASRRSGDPVALAAGTDHSSSSDDDDGNDADISTFIRPQKRATTAVAKAERAAVSHTHGSSNKLPATTAAVVLAVPGISLESKVMTKAKNFVMDSEMKNFDPAEWKNGRGLNKSICTESCSIVMNSENDVSVSLPLKTAEQAILSPVMRKRSDTTHQNQNDNQNRSISDDESEDEDTSRLNISICDAEKILAKHSSASASGQNKKRVAADMEESEIAFNNKPQDNIHVIKSPINDLILKKRYTEAAEKDTVIVLLNDENNQKKSKKVSFAGNHESDKKLLSSCNQENEPRVKMKKIEKEKENHNNNNYNNKNNNSNNDTNNDNSEIVTVILNNVRYTRLNVLGKGGSSCVYRVLSQSDSQLYAYKRVEVKGCAEDSEAMFDSYVNEIDLLKRLKGSSPYIIELVDAEINREELYIAIIMEAGDIDLSKVLSQKQIQPSYFHQNSFQNANQNSNQNANQNLQHLPRLSHTSSNSHSSNNNNNNNSNCDGNARAAHAPTSTSTSDNRVVLNPFFVRLMWLEMLEAVDHIHANRIVHGDLKPANFVFVKGHLKLIDFGIAKAFSNDTTNIYRQSQIGTVNYMAPEAIAPYCMDPGSDSRPGDRGGGDRDGEGDDHEGMSMRLGRASDIWSLGCILYQMIYGRPPFAALTTIQKLRAIPDDKYVIQYPSESEFNVDWDAVGTIQACLQRDPRKRARIKGENGLLSMPFLSIDAMQHSRIRNEDKYENNHENKDENRSQKVLKDKNNDNCISVSKDKVKNAMSFAMKYFKRKSKEHSSEQEEQFLLEKVWERLCGREEGEGNDLMIDEKKSGCLERVRVESFCDRRKEIDSKKENDRRKENDDKIDDSDGDESVGADAVAVKLPQRPRVVRTLPSSHHLSHPTPSLSQPLSSSQPLPLPLSLSSCIQTLPQKIEKDSRITSSAKQLTGVGKDTGAVRFTSSSNGSPATTDTVSGSISGTVTGTGSVTGTGTGSVTGTGTRQSTRLALVDAAAAIARRRAATVTVHVDKEYSQTPSSFQHHQQEQHQEQEQQRSQREQQQQQRPLRQPLRTLPFHQEQSTTPHNITEFKVQSPDKHDPKSVLEKRIGAMRKFLDDEMPADDTGTLDFMDGISFF